MFGAIFLFSFGKEPRQFRNAIWLTLFVLFFLGALIIVSEQEWLIIVVLLAILIAPFIVIVFLLVNTVSVVKHEGFSLSTALPGLFALVMIVFIALYVFTPSYWPQWVADVGGLVLLEGLWFFFTFAALLVYSWFYRMLPRKRRYEYIIVHGAGLNGDKPTPLLKGRLDKAVELWERQGKYGLFIVSGGQGGDEIVSEAKAMRDYLIEDRHISADAIVEENHSTTTMENLVYSKAIISARNAKAPQNYRAALVTSDYHVFRASEYAHEIGLDADGVGSATKGYYLPTAFIREFVAISRAHMWPYIVIAAIWFVWVVVFGVLLPLVTRIPSIGLSSLH